MNTPVVSSIVRRRIFRAGLLAALALAACSGRSLVPVSTNTIAAQSAAGSVERTARTPHATTQLTFTTPTVAPSGAPVDWSAKPSFLSPATASVSGRVGSTAFGPIAISPLTPGCVSASNGWQCTITVTASAGQGQTFTYDTWSTANGTGPPLGVSLGTPVNVFAGQNNYAAATLVYGLPKSVHVVPSATTVAQGYWSTVSFLAYGIDAAGEIIPSAYVWSLSERQPLAYTLTFSGPQGGSVKRKCCGELNAPPVYYTYSGVGTQAESIVAGAPGLTSTTATVSVVPGFTGLAPLLTGGGPGLLEFSATANGNAMPLRDMLVSGAAGSDFMSEGYGGDFWLGQGTRFTNSGTLVKSVSFAKPGALAAVDSHGNLYTYWHSGGARDGTCTVDEYLSPFHSTSTSPVREIDFQGAAACTAPGYPLMTVDESGNIFVASNPNNNHGGVDQILEYSPDGGSGFVPPIRTIDVPSYGMAVLDSDANGNVYTLFLGAGLKRVLYEYAPGATTATSPLPGMQMDAFAVDEKGDLYVTSGAQLEEFPAGSTTPSRSIQGSATRLGGGRIVVPRLGH